jgi:ubiquinone biosynthesis protein Coq4
MEPELAARIARLRTAHPAALDRGSERIWMARLGDITMPLPNFRWRREALDLHDANHLLTGFDFSAAGECRLAAWELGRGCYSSRYARGLCLALLATGLLFGPLAIVRAWRAGRKAAVQAIQSELR